MSIASNNHTFNRIQRDTAISPRILREYLNHLKKAGYISEENKNWQPHKGLKKTCFLTEKGGNHLIQTTLLNFVDTLTKLVSAAKNPDLKELFRQERAERVNRTRNLIDKYLEECAKKGLNFREAITQLGVMEKSKIESHFHTQLQGDHLVFDHGMNQPLIEAVKKLFELQLYFNFQVDNPEEIVRDHWAIFSPGMKLFYMHKLHTRPNLDNALREIENEALYHQ